MHYFSPVDKIELLEIIRAKQTSDETLSTAVNIGLQQGKIIIVVNDGPGFYTTRLLIFACIEVFYLLQEGLTPKEIDQATKKFGFHVGLATLIDEFGIDIILYIIYHLRKIFGDRLANDSIIELLEIKSRQGLYVYQDSGNRETNSKLKELIQNSLIQVQEM
jgi:enoyl-CoA hydratase/long-chain 3-hydroxyacyl-CoA dehydrogenase